MKEKPRYYAVTNNRLLQPFLRHRLTALAMHWAFQNMLNMDVTELAFKLGLDALLALLFGVLLGLWLPGWAAVALGLLLAHTINFLVNGQIFVVLKHFGDVHHTRLEFEQVIAGIQQRLGGEPSIGWGAVYGSLTRGELRPTSDLDVRLIRQPGLVNGLRACWFVLRERTRAHLSGFPIDFLVLDSPRLLKRMRPDEPPLVIYDATNPVKDQIPHAGA